jgi:hypothetical protein
VSIRSVSPGGTITPSVDDLGGGDVQIAKLQSSLLRLKEEAMGATRKVAEMERAAKAQREAMRKERLASHADYSELQVRAAVVSQHPRESLTAAVRCGELDEHTLRQIVQRIMGRRSGCVCGGRGVGLGLGQACLAEREQDIQQLGQIITAVQRGDIQLEHLQQLDLSGGLYSERDRAKPKSAAERAKDEQPAKYTAIPTEEVTWEVRWLSRLLHIRAASGGCPLQAPGWVPCRNLWSQSAMCSVSISTSAWICGQASCISAQETADSPILVLHPVMMRLNG